MTRSDNVTREIDLNEVLPEVERFVIPEVEVVDGGAGDDGSLTVSAAGYLLYIKAHFKILSGKHRGTVIFDQINVEIDKAPAREKSSNAHVSTICNRPKIYLIWYLISL